MRSLRVTLNESTTPSGANAAPDGGVPANPTVDDWAFGEMARIMALGDYLIERAGNARASIRAALSEWFGGR